ncbi:MAG TPA: AAA family ATPase, partial [Candidatus Paenibacillus intestinavium]|nr:AAA family ATPase [Candidatus Paenibacillus intestinavium]
MKNLIIINKKDKTEEVLAYDINTDSVVITYKSNPEKPYKYKQVNCSIHNDPTLLDVDGYAVLKGEKELTNITLIEKYDEWLKVYFKNGNSRVYNEQDIKLVKNKVTLQSAIDVIQYFKKITPFVDVTNKDNSGILVKKVSELIKLREDSICYHYFHCQINTNLNTDYLSNIIFPFGFNLSQKNAVQLAMENKISIIEGPPGTGKTQTILNLIANLLLNNKTIAMISGNNSAALNVYEKLDKYGLSFLVAKLGNNGNKEEFINNQPQLPNMSSWKLEEQEEVNIIQRVATLKQQIEQSLEAQTVLSKLKLEQLKLLTEKDHFGHYFDETYEKNKLIQILKRNKINPDRLIKLWIDLEAEYEKRKKIGLSTKIVNMFKHHIFNLKFYDSDIYELVAALQYQFYFSKLNEINQNILINEKIMRDLDYEARMGEYTDLSMKLLKNKIYKKYSELGERKIYNIKQLASEAVYFTKQYPITISTTFSLRMCYSSNFMFDYVIVDEASQVDLITGALSMSCAKNAVIVGDTKQLPNVVGNNIREKIDPFFININEAYNYGSNSLLKSCLDVFNSAPRTLLKEHYRCHPKIINFCNEKFYNNELVIMTNDDGSEALKVYKTVPGNHKRNGKNSREIDVIFQELVVREKLDIINGSIGIVTPYNKQVDEIEKIMVNNFTLEVATVHKYQGREKESIIISTVDNKVSDFTDNENLLNVAVSRAQKQLFLVTNGNEKSSNRNI